MLEIGPYRLQSVPGGTFALDGGAMFGVVPRPLWGRTNPPDERNRVDLGLRLLLVRGPDRVFLVDTGIGDKFDEKSNAIYKVAGKLPDDAVRDAGVEPRDVTDVVLTHCHFDHAGGAVRRDGTPVFPQARYHLQRKQLEWAREPTPKDRGSFRPDDFMPLYREGRLVLHEGRTELADGIELLPVDGHTPAMQLVKVSGGGRTLLYLADLAPTRAHLRLPFVMAYDNEPLKTVREKARIFALAAAEEWVLFFEHDPACAASRVVQGAKDFEAGEEVSLS